MVLYAGILALRRTDTLLMPVWVGDPYLQLMRSPGFEPGTDWLKARCSTVELRTPLNNLHGTNRCSLEKQIHASNLCILPHHEHFEEFLLRNQDILHDKIQ